MSEIIKEKKVVPKKENSSKVLKVVALRNRFFFVLYRYSSLVFSTSLASFIFSIIFLIFFAKQPIPPQYIALNPDNTYMKLEPLDTEKTESEVVKFAMSGVKKMYKYDYINYSEQLQEAASYFTEDGWNDYLDQYVKSNTLQAVKENKWIVTMIPDSVPIILKKSVVDGIFTWEMQMKIQVMYVGGAGQSQRGDLYMKIVRNSVINNPEGLGISKAIFQPK